MYFHRVLFHRDDTLRSHQICDLELYCTPLRYTITLSPAAGTSTPVTFGDTKEGLFGIRLRDELRESDGSVVTSSAGAVGSEAAYGCVAI